MTDKPTKRKGHKHLLTVAGDETIVTMLLFRGGVLLATTKRIYAVGDEKYLKNFSNRPTNSEDIR